MIVPASNPLCFYCEGCLRRLRNTTCSRSRDTNACRRRITYASMPLPCTRSLSPCLVNSVALSPFRRSNFSIFSSSPFFSSHSLLVSREDISQPEYITRLNIFHAGTSFLRFPPFCSNQVREKMVPRLIYSFHKRCAQKIGVKEIP